MPRRTPFFPPEIRWRPAALEGVHVLVGRAACRAARRRTALGTILLASAVLGFPPARAGADGLPRYSAESDLLVDTPGTTNSVAGGLFNPASWAVQRNGGFFLSWDDAPGDRAEDDYAGVVSLHHLGFGVRQFRFEPVAGDPFQVRDYVVGFSAGTRSAAWGASYGWGGGDLDRAPRHERITLGSLYRHRNASLGLAWTRDLEVRDNTMQADLGLRPLGPRLTFFGDAVYAYGESWDDIRTGWGIEAKVTPGIAAAFKLRNTGELSFRLNVALARRADLSYRPHLGDGGDRTSSTYAIEIGAPRTWLGQSSPGRGRQFPAIEMKGSLAYQRYAYFDKRPTLLEALQKIQQLGDNPRVGGVVLNLSGFQANRAQFWELRAQLAGLRARGKRVIVYLDQTELFPYAFATVADEIWIDRSGGLDLRGMSLGRTFMRPALDKLGLGVDEWRFFTYKSAFESYSRDSMSEPDREQRQALVEDFYAEAVGTITTARGMTREEWDTLVLEKGVLTAADAQTAGLVDSIGSWADAREAAKRVPRRASGDGGTASFGRVLGDPVWGPEEWGEPDRIAVLYAIGACEMDAGIRGRQLSKAIRAAREDRKVKAIVLRADSPGGEALPSDLVAREMAETAKEKPVIVSQGLVAGSGGYWISMNADTIVSTPYTITGSIGVIGGWIWNKQFGDKLGFEYDGVKSNEHADLGEGIRLPLVDQVVPDRPLTADERDRMEMLLRGMYRDFVGYVAEAREMSPEAVDAIGQGRVWSGRRAKENGLVDEIGGLWRALEIAKRAAGIPMGRPVTLPEGPELGKFDFSGLRPRLIGLWSGQRSAEREPVAEAVAATPALRTTPLTAAETEYLRFLLRSPGRPILMMEPFEVRDGGVTR